MFKKLKRITKNLANMGRFLVGNDIDIEQKQSDLIQESQQNQKQQNTKPTIETQETTKTVVELGNTCTSKYKQDGDGFLISNHDIDDGTPRYPPFRKGVEVCNPKSIINSQGDLIHQLKLVTKTNSEVFNRYMGPIIMNYAKFVHLLPASAKHHHKGIGGLFRHGLEVAKYTVQIASSHVLARDLDPQQRKRNEPKWLICCAIAGLLHDCAKAVSDLSVRSEDGEVVWNPFTSDIYNWAKKYNLSMYFITWKANHTNQHESLKGIVANSLITEEIKAYLSLDDNNDILESLMYAINMSNTSNIICQSVIKADSESVRRDLKNNGADVNSFAFGIPVEKFIISTIQRLISIDSNNPNGKWKVNVENGKIFYLKSGLYVVWNSVEDILDLLKKDGIPAIPTNKDVLAKIIIEHGYAIAGKSEETSDGVKIINPYHRISPYFKGQTKEIELTALKFADENYLLELTAQPYPILEYKEVMDKKKKKEEEERLKEKEKTIRADEPELNTAANNPSDLKENVIEVDEPELNTTAGNNSENNAVNVTEDAAANYLSDLNFEEPTPAPVPEPAPVTIRDELSDGSKNKDEASGNADIYEDLSFDSILNITSDEELTSLSIGSEQADTLADKEEEEIIFEEKVNEADGEDKLEKEALKERKNLTDLKNRADAPKPEKNKQIPKKHEHFATEEDLINYEKSAVNVYKENEVDIDKIIEEKKKEINSVKVSKKGNTDFSSFVVNGEGMMVSAHSEEELHQKLETPDKDLLNSVSMVIKNPQNAIKQIKQKKKQEEPTYQEEAKAKQEIDDIFSSFETFNKSLQGTNLSTNYTDSTKKSKHKAIDNKKIKQEKTKEASKAGAVNKENLSDLRNSSNTKLGNQDKFPEQKKQTSDSSNQIKSSIPKKETTAVQKEGNVSDGSIKIDGRVYDIRDEETIKQEELNKKMQDLLKDKPLAKTKKQEKLEISEIKEKLNSKDAELIAFFGEIEAEIFKENSSIGSHIRRDGNDCYITLEELTKLSSLRGGPSKVNILSFLIKMKKLKLEKSMLSLIGKNIKFMRYENE